MQEAQDAVFINTLDSEKKPTAGITLFQLFMLTTD